MATSRTSPHPVAVGVSPQAVPAASSRKDPNSPWLQRQGKLLKANSVAIILAISSGTTAAVPLRVDRFTAAMAESKKSGRPVAVYVHGSSWHGASRIFGEKIWNTPEFTKALQHDVILTDIHVRQHLDKEAAKTAAEAYKGWNRKTVRTYPALQIHATDGHLLKTWQGGEFRLINSPDTLADHINSIVESAAKRRELLKKIAAARKDADLGKETTLLCQLIELPVENESKIVEQLKKADPDDSSGWQARLSFKNWEFVRHITGLIKGEKADEALAEINALLATSHHTPDQRALILGAKGKTLVAQNKLPEAWNTFEEARRTDPNGPNGKAIWRYGIRVAGTPLRVIVPPGSTLSGKNLGENLTRDHASFTLSSAGSDNPEHHSTLFKGNHSPSGFAFHTDSEKDAHIIIDLKAACTVNALRITNRNNLHERAATLTLWTSTDGKIWEQAWTAPEVAPAWDILLESPVQARYLKLGLNRDTPGTLHLRTVDAYGVRPK